MKILDLDNENYFFLKGFGKRRGEEGVKRKKK